jgi:hypothetical protein
MFPGERKDSREFPAVIVETPGLSASAWLVIPLFYFSMADV